MSLDALFDDMAGATSSSSGVFFTEGNYGVALKEIEYRPNGHKGKSVIFRFTVLESNSPSHSAQSTRVWINKLDGDRDKQKRALADIKNMVFSLLGVSPTDAGTPEQNPKAHEQATQIFKAALDATFAEKTGIDSKMLIGRQAQLEVIMTKRKDGGDFSKHVWAVRPAA